jgi:serine/threonine protein kinase
MKVEKQVLQLAGQTHHPFLVNLHSSFQTDSRVFFVMEYVSGGDLMVHLQSCKRFEPKIARFYSSEILLGLQFLHENNILYRYPCLTKGPEA